MEWLVNVEVVDRWLVVISGVKVIDLLLGTS
jgi:hypothetical protein